MDIGSTGFQHLIWQLRSISRRDACDVISGSRIVAATSSSSCLSLADDSADRTVRANIEWQSSILNQGSDVSREIVSSRVFSRESREANHLEHLDRSNKATDAPTSARYPRAHTRPREVTITAALSIYPSAKTSLIIVYNFGYNSWDTTTSFDS